MSQSCLTLSPLLYWWYWSRAAWENMVLAVDILCFSSMNCRRLMGLHSLSQV